MKGVAWVFDVQDLIGEQPTWWWKPLTFVTDVQTADEFCDLFISSPGRPASAEALTGNLQSSWAASSAPAVVHTPSGHLRTADPSRTNRYRLTEQNGSV